MNDILCRQLALDYCCAEQEVRDKENHFTVYRFLEGGRRYLKDQDCYLKIAVVNGKLLFSGQEDMIAWCREQYQSTGGAWFCEAKNLRKLNDRLHTAGFQIATVHPFFLPGKAAKADPGSYGIRWYEADEIEQFRGDARFDKAYTFWPEAPDVLGVAALWDGRILGMAGASRDSETMWQIGINVDADARVSGVGTLLVTLLKDEILARGKLPYYGTAMSHLASQRVALASGFLPAWVELITSRI